MTEIDISGFLPGERLIIKIIDLAEKIIEGQPKEVKAELWKIHLEDVKWWRRVFGLKIPGEE